MINEGLVRPSVEREKQALKQAVKDEPFNCVCCSSDEVERASCWDVLRAHITELCH